MRTGRIWLALFAIFASLLALAMIINDYPGIIAVFERTDPTGSFGIYFHIGGLAANLAVILMASCVLMPGSRADLKLGYAVIAFVPSLLEALGALPCFLAARPGALCGIGLVFVAWLAVPIVIIAAVGFVTTARRRLVKVGGIVAAAVFAGSIATAQALLAPSDPGQCRAFSDVTKRSNCLKAFAERAQDEKICRAIEFRATRFACLREVALAKRQPRLCAEIADPGPITAYEAPAARYRDACFQNLAYALHDPRQCGEIADPQLRARCRNGVR
jgi:hypothetical protein